MWRSTYYSKRRDFFIHSSHLNNTAIQVCFPSSCFFWISNMSEILSHRNCLCRLLWLVASSTSKLFSVYVGRFFRQAGFSDRWLSRPVTSCPRQNKFSSACSINLWSGILNFSLLILSFHALFYYTRIRNDQETKWGLFLWKSRMENKIKEVICLFF